MDRKQFLQEDNTIDVIHPLLESEYELFFGPVSKDSNPLFYDGKDLAEIFVETKLAPSFSWCRKNGWNRKLKSGFQEIVFGKNKVRIFVLTI